MHTRKEQMEAFGRFLDILDELREKCPWDRKQTNESLRPNTIEETYELCDALIRDDKNDICKELGDVLLHVAFYAKIGSETGDFDMKDVCDRLCEKLIFRHPHVFGDVMFSLINAARLYKINPDNALEQTNQKFINRFNYVEAHSIKEGKNLHDMTLEEMDKLWEAM